jgi:hypothetical protein
MPVSGNERRGNTTLGVAELDEKEKVEQSVRLNRTLRVFY